eukprot:GFYU01009492.1.p1 GENE.GFYU01009492.1~~GFYU01009492.1.p1  ORF type:complete len:701 (+),score=85.97 GFYU01009492.1:8-2110(+)
MMTRMMEAAFKLTRTRILIVLVVALCLTSCTMLSSHDTIGAWLTSNAPARTVNSLVPGPEDVHPTRQLATKPVAGLNLQSDSGAGTTRSILATHGRRLSTETDESAVQCWANGSDVAIPCVQWPWFKVEWVLEPRLKPDSRRTEQRNGVHLTKETIDTAWKATVDKSRLNNTLDAPIITHTNIHACPAVMGVCPPPVKHPLRFDSTTISGDFGDIFEAELDLVVGSWLIVAHVRVQETVEGKRDYKYDMTLTRTVTIEGTGSVDEESGDPKETPVLAISTTVVCVFMLPMVFVFYWRGMRTPLKQEIIAAEGAFKYHQRFNIHVAVIDSILVVCFAMWTALLVDACYQSQQNPDIALKVREHATMKLPTVMLCPFLAGGSVQNVDISFYPNLYGFVRFNDVKVVEDLVLSVVDASDGSILERKCVVYNFDDQKVATSTFSSLFITAVVNNANNGTDNALLSILETSEVGTITSDALLKNHFVSHSKATNVRVTVHEKVRLSGDVIKSFEPRVAAVENPYEIRQEKTEMVIMVQFESMDVQVAEEVWTISRSVTLSLIIGASSGVRLLRMFVFMAYNHYYSRQVKRAARIVSKSGEIDPKELKMRGSSLRYAQIATSHSDGSLPASPAQARQSRLEPPGSNLNDLKQPQQQESLEDLYNTMAIVEGLDTAQRLYSGLVEVEQDGYGDYGVGGGVVDTSSAL